MLTPRDRAVAIVKGVAAAHALPVSAIMGRNRGAELVLARHEAFALVRWMLGWSYPRIGRFFGRDHSTVLHGVRRYEARRASMKEAA